MFELIYTSAPKGLLPGRTGFSTVAFTAGMPPNLLTPLENLSGYEFTFKGNTLPEAYNPPVHSFIRLRYGATVLRVASRIAPNGLDYTMRNNKIAHHILFEHDEELDCFPSGAAGLFGIPGNFAEKFDEAPHELPLRHITECAVPAELPAVAWQKFTGDAGWAGAVAERFLRNAKVPFFVEYPLTVNPEELLCLLGEVTELLPPELRKDFTFSTYFTRERPGEDCFLRMLPEFSPLLGALKRFHPEQILTLGAMQDVPAAFAASELVALAREGRELPEPPEMPEIAPPDPPVRLRYADVRATTAPQPTETATPAADVAARPRPNITREYVPDAKERIVKVFRWSKWMIVTAALVIFLLIGIFVLNMLKNDVNWKGLRENAQFAQEMLNPDSAPATSPDKTPPPAENAVPAAKKTETPPPEKTPDVSTVKPPEAVTRNPLPEELQATLFLDLQALAKSTNGDIDLPPALAGALGVKVLPENARTAAIVTHGKLRFAQLPLPPERRKVLQEIRRLEFQMPGNQAYDFEVPRPGRFQSSPEGAIAFAAGEGALKNVGAYLEDKLLTDGQTIVTLPVKNYNDSVVQFSKFLDSYFKQTGADNPYTESRWRGELKKILPDKKKDDEPPPPVKQTEEKLAKLIDSTHFGRFDGNVHIAVSRMAEILQSAVEERYEVNALDEIQHSVANSWEKAYAREKFAQDKRMELKRKRSGVNNQLKNLRIALEKLPVAPDEQKRLGKQLWQMLGIRNFGLKDEPLAMDFEAPDLLTAQVLKALADSLSAMIYCKKLESGAAQ